MKELTVRASLDQTDAVTAFANEFLEKMGCSARSQMQIDVAIDEIFSNIAKYAYGGREGKTVIRVSSLENGARVRLTFIDGGEPFNPLEKEEPDVTAGLEERQIGGLGILLVKKTMENLQYRYENGKNIFSFEKTI